MTPAPAPTCATPPCMVVEDGKTLTSRIRIVHCKWHAAGPLSLMLLKDLVGYLKSFRSTPQRDHIVKSAQAILDNAGVR